MHTPMFYLCWLCGEAVDLRTCKIDEYGEHVHEACYTARIALESGTRRAMPVSPKVEIRSGSLHSPSRMRSRNHFS
jgi:hypothetical protein